MRKNLRSLIVSVAGFLIAGILGVLLLPGSNEFLPNFDTAGRTPTTSSTTESHIDTDYYTVDSVGQASFSPSCPASGYYYEGIIDEDGRVGAACAVLTHESFMDEKKQKREDISSFIPAGYTKNRKVPIFNASGKAVSNDWFYNRSHLIADSLGGEGSLDNLITGTRTQNVGVSSSGGMQYIEKKVSDYLAKTNNCPVRYQVTPNYLPGEIVPRTVTVNAASCDGQINETVTTYNTAEGYTIDYTTGKWSEDK